MKTTLLLLALALPAAAEFRSWTASDGRKAELDLVSVTDKDGEKVGEFRMRNGRSASIKASGLSEDDAKLLDDFKPAPAAGAVGKASVFDEILDGNLVKLDGDDVKSFQPEAKPKKFYIFYYTASWCGPCQAYTPTLVKFYNDHKPKNDSFEVVVITCDRDEVAMNGYMKKKNMPWPALKMADAEKFKQKFNHGVNGIPAVITCKLDGTIVSRNGDPQELAKLVK
ncbi:MAG: thioredoxin-like domain-containing protein [Verrucomicrobia bacterium]|nr:thioredoxin-like domain-containing protein [Verrucomicrobiota bacterium]